ncbi:RIC3 acetylcholine receptor chaperone isoform X1 [Megalopta genalis]|uniref:RIC3 acetylcholine receptor chaperone isoform X1 n=1 Tax=Megalopta genalis TaxID=115081 RepID=UPI003FD0B4DF
MTEIAEATVHCVSSIRSRSLDVIAEEIRNYFTSNRNCEIYTNEEFTKMAEITDFGPRKTIFILAIVASCFAVLWPKIFYPMLTASVTPHHTPDNSACCDVIFESDVTAADIMQEMCQNILKHHQVDPRVRDVLSVKLTPQSANLCREEILDRCGIDLFTFLADRERLGKSYKQVLEEIRSFNSSLCLKTHFGIPLSQLGTPHLIRYHILMPHSTIQQERRTPPHAGGLHPALRERGRAIPSSHIVPKVTDRPDHVIPKMRPPLGGAGHVVSAPKGSGTMGIIMPLYTLGIVLFFLYTIIKVLKKSSDSEIISEYPGAAAEKEFRKMVFSPEAFASAMTGGTMQYCKERSPSPHRPPPTIEELKDQAAGDIEIDQLRRRLVETEAAMERIVVQMGNISRTVMHSPSSQQELKGDAVVEADHSQADEEVANIENSPTVKVMGMEMTASCEGKGSRPTTPIIPVAPSHVEREKTPPKPIYLEGALPPQCELLVTDSETQAQKAEEDAEAPVVLSGKMTLSLISVDQNAAESEGENQERRTVEDEIVLNTDYMQIEHETSKIGSTGEMQDNGKVGEDGSRNQQRQEIEIQDEEDEDELDEGREKEEEETEEEEVEVEEEEEEVDVEEEEEVEVDVKEEEEEEEEEVEIEVDEADEYEEEEIEEEEEDSEENENVGANESGSSEAEAEDETDEEEESETENMRII